MECLKNDIIKSAFTAARFIQLVKIAFSNFHRNLFLLNWVSFLPTAFNATFSSQRGLMTRVGIYVRTRTRTHTCKFPKRPFMHTQVHSETPKKCTNPDQLATGRKVNPRSLPQLWESQSVVYEKRQEGQREGSSSERAPKKTKRMKKDNPLSKQREVKDERSELLSRYRMWEFPKYSPAGNSPLSVAFCRDVSIEMRFQYFCSPC